MIHKFQHKAIPAFMGWYERVLRSFLKNRRPWYMFWGTVVALILVFILTAVVKLKVEFFPSNQPNRLMYILKCLLAQVCNTLIPSQKLLKKEYMVLSEKITL